MSNREMAKRMALAGVSAGILAGADVQRTKGRCGARSLDLAAGSWYTVIVTPRWRQQALREVDAV